MYTTSRLKNKIYIPIYTRIVHNDATNLGTYNRVVQVLVTEYITLKFTCLGCLLRAEWQLFYHTCTMILVMALLSYYTVIMVEATKAAASQVGTRATFFPWHRRTILSSTYYAVAGRRPFLVVWMQLSILSMTG